MPTNSTVAAASWARYAALFVAVAWPAVAPLPLGAADEEPAIEVVAQAESPAQQVVDDGALRVKSIRDISLDIRVSGDAPPDVAPADLPQTVPLTSTAETRGWSDTLFFWRASNLVHKPLYFEQRYVERYGYNFGRLQPVASGVQFFGSVAVLPVKMLREPPNECVYSLGYGRPGSFGTPRPRF